MPRVQSSPVPHDSNISPAAQHSPFETMADIGNGQRYLVTPALLQEADKKTAQEREALNYVFKAMRGEVPVKDIQVSLGTTRSGHIQFASVVPNFPTAQFASHQHNSRNEITYIALFDRKLKRLLIVETEQEDADDSDDSLFSLDLHDIPGPSQAPVRHANTRAAKVAEAAEVTKAADKPAISATQDATTAKVASNKSIASYVQEHFSENLDAMLTAGLVTDHPTPAQRADNTYHLIWVVSEQQRFFAALIKTLQDACIRHDITVLPENIPVLMKQATDALRKQVQDNADIDRFFAQSHALTNDRNPPLTGKTALKNLPSRYADIQRINGIHERAAQQIHEHHPAHDLLPTAMWLYGAPQSTLAYFRKNLGIDADNPFLIYLQDTAKKSGLLTHAQCWRHMAKSLDTPLTAAVLSSLITTLWGIWSGRQSHSAITGYSLPKDNGNYTVLMEDEHAEAGTLTAAGRRELLDDLDYFKTKYDVLVNMGQDDDRTDTREYERNVVTLHRNKISPDKTLTLLNGCAADYLERVASAGQDGDAAQASHDLLRHHIWLGRALTHARALPEGNADVGLMLIQFLTLHHRQPFFGSLPSADILDGNSLDELARKAG